MQILASPSTIQESKSILNYWNLATWQEYLTYRDNSADERIKLYYYQNQLLIEMGKEGINHSSICDLLTMLFAFWFSHNSEQIFNSYGRCLLEKYNQVSAAPDIVLYLGENYPKWQFGERRYLDLDKWGIPNLVGEISDTTLATDLDEKKHLYASLNIPEYWVIDVLGKRVFCFQLQKNNEYKESKISLALKGLPIKLLNKTLARLENESNGSAAIWFSKKITKSVK